MYADISIVCSKESESLNREVERAEVLTTNQIKVARLINSPVFSPHFPISPNESDSTNFGKF